MNKPTKDSVLVESYQLKGGRCIRDDQWMSKKQLKEYEEEIESEASITNKHKKCYGDK